MLAVIELNDRRQLAELVAGADGDLVAEVAAAHALGAGKQLVDRSGDRARERESHDERDGLDDQEQTRDHGKQDQEDLARGCSC